MYKVIIVPLVVYVFSFPVTLVSIPACFLSQVSIVMNQLVCSSHTAFAFLQATVFWPFGWHSKENVGLCSLVLVSGFWCFFFFPSFLQLPILSVVERVCSHTLVNSFDNVFSGNQSIQKNIGLIYCSSFWLWTWFWVFAVEIWW